MTRRPITAIPLNGLAPGGTPRALPIFEWVDPSTLFVDEGYQRDSSERSLRLVRRIVSGWDWAKFKSPVGVLVDEGIELIDGQHTAIAAASHPDISEIPVMIIEAPERADRAGAFISHNRDRVSVTATQLHVAALAAGQQDALAIEQVCAAACVTLLRTAPGAGRYPPASTVAVTAIGGLIRSRGPEAATRVLTLLGRGGLAPITQVEIKAADLLLHDPEYRDLSADKLPVIIAAMGPKAEAEAKMFMAAHPSVSLWKAIAVVWFKNRRTTSKAVGTAPPPLPDRPRALLPPQRRGESIASAAKKDSRPELGRWQPGNHLRRCGPCGEPFVGGRAAEHCADCAYRAEEVSRA